MVPTVFPQRYSLYRRTRRYLVEFRRKGTQVTHLWDARQAFPLGAPARYYLKKHGSRIRLVDRQGAGESEEVAALKFHTPISLKLHPTDKEPWIITLRPTAPFEPAAFRDPATLEVEHVSPPFCLYSGYRKRLFDQKRVGDFFKVNIANVPVFRYELTNNQHTLTPFQEGVTWRTFEGEAKELIKGISFCLDDTPFLEGWVEWEQHWWRMVPIAAPEGTEMFLVRNQDPNFFTRSTGIASLLVGWILYLLLPFSAVPEIEPVEPATLSVSAVKRYLTPTSDAERLAQKKLPEPVRVKITEAELQEGEDGTVLATSDTKEAKSVEARREKASRDGFTFGEGIGVRGKGELDTAKLVKQFERKREEIQTCYHGLQLKAPGKGGTVLLNWKISQMGKAEGVQVKTSEISYTPFQECLVKMISLMEMPRPKRGEVWVDFPFYFETRD